MLHEGGHVDTDYVLRCIENISRVDVFVVPSMLALWLERLEQLRDMDATARPPHEPAGRRLLQRGGSGLRVTSGGEAVPVALFQKS